MGDMVVRGRGTCRGGAREAAGGRAWACIHGDTVAACDSKSKAWRTGDWPSTLRSLIEATSLSPCSFFNAEAGTDMRRSSCVGAHQSRGAAL